MCMISFNKTDKVEIFIDLMNVESVVGRSKVDYSVLCRCLAMGRPISNVIIFDSNVNTDDQKKLHAELKRHKFRIETPKGSCYNKEKQIGVDVLLATKVTTHALKSQCDVIIIVSGDGDFIPVIDLVKSTGKKIEFAAFGECANNSLIEETDRFAFIEDLPVLKMAEAVL